MPGAFNKVGLIGVPYDQSSSFMRGPAEAPKTIRETLHCGSANYCTENGLDLSAIDAWRDLGDLALEHTTEAFDRLADHASNLVKDGTRLLTLGGDHALTFPILCGYARHYPDLTVLQLDAHPDLYDTYDASKTSHACTFARVMEAGCAGRLIQYGIRAMNPHQQAQAERFGVEVITMSSCADGLPPIDGPTYVSLDLDCFDPAFAPGVSHHEPGGLTPREVIGLVQGLSAPLVGADIVELNPRRDPTGITAMLAAKFTKELLAKLLTTPPVHDRQR